MEPILELATQITSHLWLLHGLYPRLASLPEISDLPWKEKLSEQAREDFAALQDLLDLAQYEALTDWDQADPLSRISFVEDIVPSTNTRNPFKSFQGWRAAKARREETSESRKTEDRRERLRELAAINPIQIIANRIAALAKHGMLEGISLAPSLTQPDPRFLTREALFDRVSTWLFVNAGQRDLSLSNLQEFKEQFIRQDPDDRVPKFMLEKEIELRISKLSRKERQQQLVQEWQVSRDRILLHRGKLREFCSGMGIPSPFSIVGSDELDEVAHSRCIRYRGAVPENAAPSEIRTSAGMSAMPGAPATDALEANLFGLALSGGGIRSATFALGLLQGMADRNLLPYVDVLSTVSGGGYIGSWLISWIKRRGSVNSVQQSLRGSAPPREAQDANLRRLHDIPPVIRDPLKFVTRDVDPRSDHVRPIRLLREYSRYLAPRAGFFSADTWTIAATWMRNTILNLSVLLLSFAALLLVPRLAVFFLVRLRPWTTAASTWHFGLLMLLASIPLFGGTWLIGSNVKTFGPFRRDKNSAEDIERSTRGDNDFGVVTQILTCVVAAAFLQLAVLWNTASRNASTPIEPWTAFVSYSVVLAIAMFILIFFQNFWNTSSGETAFRFGISVFAWLGSAAAGGGFIYAIDIFLNNLGSNTERGVWIAGSVGLVLMLIAFSGVIVVFLGLCGRSLGDDQREWWSRLGAWLGLTIGGWLVACVICFFMPLWIAQVGLRLAALIASVGWLAITGAGLKLAFSPESGAASADEQRIVARWTMNLAPYVFSLGVLSAASFGVYWIIQTVLRFPKWSGLIYDPAAHELCCTELPLSLQRMIDYYWPLMYADSWVVLILIAVFTLLALILAARVDVNEFSMHHFYKNRLVRAYLGASRARSHRWPNAFTGFDLEDDIRMFRFQYDDPCQPRDMLMDCRCSYAGPFPIINTTLNVTQGADLGIQERKAESFVFTPLWSGFDFSRRQTAVRKTNLSEYGFQRTEQFGDPENRGALLGTAMAISGAAFNSNAGFHTSPSLAFLLTIFGVRLGWWAGNPRGSKWTKSSPPLGLFYLGQELTANTSSSSPFVLLSDGGHFENMGIYELVRRRCRYIILSDAEEDAKFKLEGIGGAIRKCRDDFGVSIELNLDALEPLGDPSFSRLHYSLGTISYPGVEEPGLLVYIKSSMTGDEPIDIVEFRKRHEEFPHTSTVDQFFDESHFESYRALGHHIASDVFGHDIEPLPTADEIAPRVTALFKDIKEDWEKRMKFVLERESGK